MDDYIALVRKLSDSHSNEIVSNSSADHASVLINEMFRRGCGDAYIFSGTLNTLIYGREDVVDAIGAFLADGRGKLKIVVQGNKEVVPDDSLDGSSNTGLIGKVKSHYGNDVASKIEIKRGSDKVSALPCHFTVVGKDAFRFEPDKTKHEAFASFNRPEMAKTLVTVFDDIWNKSETITIN